MKQYTTKNKLSTFYSAANSNIETFVSVTMTKDAKSGSSKTPSFEMTWGSSTSSGYCSEDDCDTEFEQYFTARTSFVRKPKKEKVRK